jgi:predicted thioesterase
LCEEAAVRSLAGALDGSQTTVGTHVDLAHVVPTVVGRRATAHARLDRVDGRTLHFSVVASDESGEIARGTHTRVIVDRDRFLRGAVDRA